MPPHKLQEQPWLSLLDAHIVVPENAVTCHQGKGTTVDHFVISNCLRNYVKAYIIGEVPSGPHDGIGIRVQSDPEAAKETYRVEPKGPMCSKETGLTRVKTAMSWDKCYEKATEEIGADIVGKFPKEVKDLSARLGIENSANKATIDYAR